jgi:hypothetical protein
VDLHAVFLGAWSSKPAHARASPARRRRFDGRGNAAAGRVIGRRGFAATFAPAVQI